MQIQNNGKQRHACRMENTTDCRRTECMDTLLKYIHTYKHNPQTNINRRQRHASRIQWHTETEFIDRR